MPMTSANMRMFRLETKCFVAVVTALSLLMTMSRPWYGPTPASADGPRTLEALASALVRWLAERDGDTAWQALGRADTAIAALTVVCGLAALLCLSASTEQVARTVLFLGTLALCGLLAFALVKQPASSLEPRYGIFVAIGLAIVLLITASGINDMSPLSRRRRAFDAA